MDCSVPGFSVHGISQARILEWVAISFSRGSSQPSDRIRVSCTVGRCFHRLHLSPTLAMNSSSYWTRSWHSHPSHLWSTAIHVAWGFPCGLAGNESACNVGDLRSIPGLGRSPGERKGYPLQYSGLENSMDCIVPGVAESWTPLSNFHFTSQMDWHRCTMVVQRRMIFL